MNCLVCNKCTVAGYNWSGLFDHIRISAKYPAGATVIVEGEPLSGLIVDCSGAVKVTMTTQTGKSVVLKICKPGEVIGLADLLTDRISSIRCTTLLDSELSLIPWRYFEQTLGRHAEALKSVASQIAFSVKSERERLRELVCPSVRARMNSFLRSLFRPIGTDTSVSVVVPFPYTNEQIAEILGCTRESVSRLMSALENAGAIERHGTRLTLAADFERQAGPGQI
jgi:CRP/FNR family transcriptional regulator